MQKERGKAQKKETLRAQKELESPESAAKSHADEV